MRDGLRLLAHAARRYDAAGSTLPAVARRVRSLHAGGEWMRLALGELRAGSVPANRADFRVLGLSKYGLALLAAVATVPLAVGLASAWPLLLAAPLFYAVEAQMVFLFPVAIDGAEAPLSAARRLTRRAGGTLAVMATIVPVAAYMLAGGFLGRGFRRAWAVGCLAVVLWYEEVRG